MIKFSIFKPTITGAIWQLVYLISAILIVFLAILAFNISDISEISSQVENTEIIEKELHSLQKDLLDAETGQRGYLLTLNENYLEPYEAGVTASRESLERLQAIVINPEIRRYLAPIQQSIDKKMYELAITIQLAKQGQQAAALARIKENNGKRYMDEFRSLTGAALAEEQNQLAERQKHFEYKFKKIIIFMTFGGIVTLVMMILASRTTRRLGSPVVALLESIQKITDGDLSHPVPVSGNDEISRIASAFNQMREDLLATQQARDKVQSELERSNAELDNFAYVASHDLKAPLRGIRNLAGWINEDLQNAITDETHANIALLLGRVDRLERLLESLLAYSRVGRNTASAEEVNSGELVADISDYLAPPPGFSITCTGDMPILSSPKTPLELVLRNLINNAIKHHDRKVGKVVVSAKKQGSNIEFRVEDDGPGIAAEFHERIFQMFQTLKPRDQVEGSGMGLAIVKKSIEGFGGSIKVESNPPTRGTTFVFTWPQK